ncbi:uncharacterized protein LOC103511343 [Diaphorina citri]|uniref:Uncharacterized protein LOC103511343 n=1 Tax=Diaphorina citri TaxID=121845 RepID=A0A3Q0IXH9_DIACI|nr:uncharacterized protein LOC103511343 [Diaphorina citri]
MPHRIVDKVFRLVDQDADGLVTPRQIMELLATVSNSRPRSGFDKGNLEWLEQLFRQTVGDEKEICRDDFKKILITKNISDLYDKVHSFVWYSSQYGHFTPCYVHTNGFYRPSPRSGFDKGNLEWLEQLFRQTVAYTSLRIHHNLVCLPRSGFDKGNLEWLEQLFRQTVAYTSLRIHHNLVCLPRSGFDKGNLEWLEQLFRQTVAYTSLRIHHNLVCLPRSGFDKGNLEWLEQLFRQTVAYTPRSGFDKGNLEWLEQLFRQTVAYTSLRIHHNLVCLPRSGFDKGNLEWLEQLFRQTVGDEKEICRDDFKKILITKNFQHSLQEFIDAMHQFAGQSPDDKIKFLFRVYDLDGDGLIQHKELQHVMRACMEENGMQFSEEQIDHLTMALFEDADSENRGAITYESLKNQLEKHGGLLENLSISIDRWLVPPKPKKLANQSRLSQLIALRPYQLTLPYIKNNYVYLGFMFFYLLVNIVLFTSRMYVFRKSNYYVIFARACGQCLNFNCMFVLVLMLRHCITFLRTRGFSVFLPLDQHIYFHKMTGFFIFGYSVLHTIMHLLNFSLNVLGDGTINKKGLSLTEWLFTSRPGLFGLINGWANPTGVCLIIILTIMFICSQTFVRKSGSFEVFYWTHLLYVPFWILLILHCPNFWKWVILPGIIYCCERIFRFTIMRCKRGKTYISSGLLLPSKVTHLVIKRPQHFDFHPGDYVFVNIPAIAQYEWHPFTISSAPEQEGYMWLHIRGVGEWTNRLYDYFEKEQEKLHNLDDPLPLASTPGPNQSPAPAQGTPQGTLPPNSVESSHNPIKRIHKKESSTESDISNIQSSIESLSSIKNLPLHKVVLLSKSPLSKSLSMPDMDNKVKKRQRLLALREYMRSESEKSFDECQMRRARLQSLGLAYLSPQNKSLAQSFRYMRNKPTIIAFKTPSLESCEAKLSALSILTQGSDIADSQSLAEEGRRHLTPGKSHPHTPMNYPVGKPLEIYLDGPYGAPSSHIFRAQHAVLIGTGIGVTPFASILQSIMHRYWKARHECPRCRHTWVSEIPPTIMHLRKVMRSTESDISNIQSSIESLSSIKNLPLHKVVLLSKSPLSKSLSMPDMDNKVKKRQRLLATLERKFSGKVLGGGKQNGGTGGSVDANIRGKMVVFKNHHGASGYTNESFCSLPEDFKMGNIGVYCFSLTNSPYPLSSQEKRDLITGLKTRTNAGRPNWDRVFKHLLDQKKGKVTVFYCGPPQLARILRLKCDQFGFSFRKEVLREYMRSESEKSFDECQMRRARLQSLGLAYLSPQNKSLAQSFRYMRNKPTIIAFKTPSLESCEAKLSALSILTQIYLDGPYGAPSSHIFRAQHAVLIGTGIGVTPFGSPTSGEKRDLITGLKTRTNAGRPNWDRVFKHLLDQKKGKVTVFYCGPPQLARILRLKCDQFGFSFRKEVF